MSETNATVDLSREVDFSYPEGFMEATAVLDFMPEEARIGLLYAFINNINLL